MRRLRALSRWATALSLTLLAACDNVEWGGAQVAIVPPPPQAGGEDGPGADGPAAERLPQGPVLYYVRPMDGQAMMTPIAEVGRESLVPVRAVADWERYGQRFIADHLRPGAEFALFRNGGRVGTFVVQSAEVPGPEVCPRVPQAQGVLELAAGAEMEPEFLALSKAHAPADDRRAQPVALAPDRRMQIVAPILAERALRARRAPLPGNWARATAQLKPFPLAGSAESAFAATFLLGDALGPENRGSGVYSVFFVAHPAPQFSYDTAFVHFADYATQGRQAPRVIDYLDWDRSGQPELLLEVYGPQGSWFEAIERTQSGWQRTLGNLCAPPPAAQTPAQQAQTRQRQE